MPEPRESLYPLQFKPVLKHYPWGGRRLATRFGRAAPEGPLAESWEISAHADGPTPVSNGPLEGADLTRLLVDLGEELVGSRNSAAVERRRFPLLVKLLDARQWLSIQVHPDDRFALARENDLGKTEMWVILDAEPGAEILLGLRPEVDRARLEQAIAAGSPAESLHRLAVSAGDVVFVPPGAVHAIGPGVTLAEIQQSSNVTYRLFDWQREPPRALHVEAALEVLDFDFVSPRATAPVALGPGAELLASCRHFRTERHRLEAGDERSGILDGSTFEIWGVLSGSASVTAGARSVDLPAISWTLLPASLDSYRLRASVPTTALRILTPAA